MRVEHHLGRGSAQQPPEAEVVQRPKRLGVEGEEADLGAVNERPAGREQGVAGVGRIAGEDHVDARLGPALAEQGAEQAAGVAPEPGVLQGHEAGVEEEVHAGDRAGRMDFPGAATMFSALE